MYILTLHGSNVIRGSLERVLELYRRISGGDVLDIARLTRREKAADCVGDHASIDVGLVKVTSNARTHAEILMVRMERGVSLEGL